MKEKYIHYCWFGGKPLPKLAKKCLKSWKKYLPGFRIIRWDESNVDLDECPFIRGAYDNRKWAFVADYARTKALYEYGGIYFDTDMLLTKNIDNLLENSTFLGVEESGMVATGVWWENARHSYFAKKMLDFYKSQKEFNTNNLFKYSIPRVMTKLLFDEGFENNVDHIQNLKHNITIYPRDYFYPMSFDFKHNFFTDNTCMIHYYDASWFSGKQKLYIKLKRIFGEKNVNRINGMYHKGRSLAGRVARKFFYRQAKYIKSNYLSKGMYKINLKKTIDEISILKGNYVVFHNSEWLGITSATIELFKDNRVSCGELFRKKDIKRLGNAILSKNFDQVIYSAMCMGWKELAYYIKKRNPNIRFKVFWHGSISQVLESYGWQRNLELIDMCKDGTIEVFGTCKESLVNFYKQLGINTHFIMNNVELEQKINHTEPDNIQIGLYAAKKDDWRKNLFAQIAAVSLIKGATIDIIPMDYEAAEFARNLGLKVTGEEKPLPRKELLKRMAQNSMNLYVTFSECAPMLPLESFEVGTICLTGNNHHYFKNHALEKYIVINNEENPIEISKKIKLCLKNKELVMSKYKDWKKQNDKNSLQSVKEFLEK